MNRKSRRRSSGRAFWILLPFLLIGAAILIVLFGFRVRSVLVVGNSTRSASAIQSDLMYDFKTNNTLYFSWKYRTAAYESRTPYLSSVQAEMTSPSSITLTVQEKTVIGYVQYNGNIVSFDSDGLVLDISDTAYDGATLVSGVTMDEPVLYQKLPLGNSALLSTVLSITKLMNDADLTPDRIEFDDNQNITLIIGSITVELGQNEYLEEKIANLEAIYPQISGQSGTLNMTAFTGKNETITFREDGESEEESETDGLTEESGEGTADGSSDGSGDTAEAENAGDESGADTQTAEDSGEAAAEESAENTDTAEEADDSQDTTTGVMVFDSSGTLHYDAHISGGEVVDASGNPIDGCTVTDEGYIKDAYWNVIDPNTGDLMNG